jgi:AcrR family transcriptional regulator
VATVFNYFPTKEDLILAPGKLHISEPAAVVREREPGQTPHGAMRDHLLHALAERHPVSGICDRPHVLRMIRLVETTPALRLRRMEYDAQSEQLLAEALIEEHRSEITARLVAAQIFGTQQVLVATNARRVLAGESPDDVYPDAVAATEHAFRLLDGGIGDLFRR